MKSQPWFRLLCLSSAILLATVACKSTASPKLTPPEPELLPTATSTSPSPFPPELAMSFDEEQCPEYCWHGIMLGQSQAEALATVRDDPWTDTTIEFQSGDYIRIEELEGRTGVTWFLRDLPLIRPIAYLEIKDGVVDGLLFPITEPFPFQILLDELGEPTYVEIHEIAIAENEESPFFIAYPEKRLDFSVSSVDYPPALTREGMVQRVIFYREAQDYRCRPSFFLWDGIGGPNKYYGWPLSSSEFVRDLPRDCKES